MGEVAIAAAPFVNPPRCTRTAYSFFVKDHFRTIATAMKAKLPQPVIKALANKWKHLRRQERMKYKLKEDEDKMRYRKEKQEWAKNFTGKLPRMRKTKKDVDAPKRSRNSFLIFAADYWPTIIYENPGLNQRELARALARRWRELNAIEKDEYKNLAKEEKQTYLERVKNYRRRKVAFLAEQRLKRKVEIIRLDEQRREEEIDEERREAQLHAPHPEEVYVLPPIRAQQAIPPVQVQAVPIAHAQPAAPPGQAQPVAPQVQPQPQPPRQ